jgi:multiple sugar transport system substrate-binding protein
MRRTLPLFITAVLLLSACFPNVTLLPHETDSVSVPGSQPVPTLGSANPDSAAAPTPFPSPTPGLGASPEALQGVNVIAWHGWGGDSSTLFAQMADEFNHSNSWGISVSVQSKPNLESLADEVSQVLGTDGQPDLLVALPEQLLGWQAGLVDLTRYAMHPAVGLAPDALFSDLMRQSNLAGSQLGMPALRSGRFLFYNVSWARELGFEAPPQTWDDFRKQACAANAFWKTDSDESNDGYGGLALDVEPNWQTPYAWLRAQGGEVFSQGVFAFETENNLAAWQNLIDLRAKGCAWLPQTAGNEENFAARRALFVTGTLGELNQQRAALSTAVSTDEWTLLPFPGTHSAVPIYGPDYAVLKTGETRQLASWLFIRWMLQPENQARWARRTGLLPVSSAALGLLRSDYAANRQKGAAADLLSQALIYPQSPQWGLADKILADGFMSLLQGYPVVTPAGTLNQMDSTLADLSR